MATIGDKLKYLIKTKELIRQAIEFCNVEVPIETPFRKYADLIKMIRFRMCDFQTEYKHIPAPIIRSSITTQVTQSLSLTTQYNHRPLQKRTINMITSAFPQISGVSSFTHKPLIYFETSVESHQYNISIETEVSKNE